MRNNTVILTAAALAVLGLGGCSEPKEPEVASGPAEYSAMKIQKSDARLQLEYSCSIKGQQDVDIFPQVSGTIESLVAHDGARVAKGDRLVIIDPVAYQAAYEKALANVSNAEADLATKKLNYDNQSTLYAQKAVSQFAMLSAKNSYSAAEAALKLAKAELMAAKNDLDHTSIVSPVNGVIGMMNYKEGALVSPQMSTPLVSVSDNSSIYAYFSISENEALEMARYMGHYQKPGEKPKAPEGVTFRLRLSDGEPFDQEGTFDAVSGVIDEATGAVSIRLLFPNPTGILRSGGSATVVIPISLKNSIVIPQVATYELQDKIFVYKVIDGKAVATQIETEDLNDGSTYVVTKGLSEGDVIIAEGAGLVRDGMPVKAVLNDSAQSGGASEQPSAAGPAAGQSAADQAASGDNAK